MTLSIQPDDSPDTGHTNCAECADKAYCNGVRYSQRPCELRATQAAIQGVGAVAPWQRARVEETTDPAMYHAHQSWCRSRQGLMFDPTRCSCGLIPAKLPPTPPTPAPATPVHSDPEPPELGPGEYAREVARGLGDIVEQTKAEFIKTFTSGARSSEQKLRYDLIPWHIFADRLAKRYTDGAVKYGEFNWQQGLTERAYVLDRANHTLVHLHRAIERMRDMSLIREQGGNLSDPFVAALDTLGDDDLAAAMWGLIFLMAAQRGSAEL